MATCNLNASKTAGVIVSEILMMSSNFNGSHFLVEGADDCKFWRPRLISQNVNLVDCEGKTNLLGSAEILNGNFTKIVGVFDADFDRHRGIVCPHNFLVHTDENDLEIMLLRSNAFNTFKNEFTQAPLVQSFEQGIGASVLEHIENVSRAFGQLRFLSCVSGHNVDFDSLSPYRFVSAANWLLDHAGLKAEYAALANITVLALEVNLTAYCPPLPAWAYSQGHDTVRILAQGLKRTIANAHMSEHDVTRILRIAYTQDMLRQAPLYAWLDTFQKQLPAPVLAS
jgi:hypothetical protein